MKPDVMYPGWCSGLRIAGLNDPTAYKVVKICSVIIISSSSIQDTHECNGNINLKNIIYNKD